MTASDSTRDSLRQARNDIKKFRTLNDDTVEVKTEVAAKNELPTITLSESITSLCKLIDERDCNKIFRLMNFNASFSPTFLLKYSNLVAIRHKLQSASKKK